MFATTTGLDAKTGASDMANTQSNFEKTPNLNILSHEDLTGDAIDNVDLFA